eukprot:CAMPEP_0202912908 /NCGR_PEP_ID=MMETSP1392-20130828/59011_1 /ASSEMBLY_ACC=CAM_ASM_000868 /TAXON_ID=225041 /ORGANISM="Chlamydomonas chlamydogama, Strain SAG 11-48b" /LENGTH=108 /DNA_ID=CAMNT_0049603989 /DNA_START=962 /DNA_END=1288 /DNA_ORIENTATION=-
MRGGEQGGGVRLGQAGMRGAARASAWALAWSWRPGVVRGGEGGASALFQLPRWGYVCVVNGEPVGPCQWSGKRRLRMQLHGEEGLGWHMLAEAAGLTHVQTWWEAPEA